MQTAQAIAEHDGIRLSEQIVQPLTGRPVTEVGNRAALVEPGVDVGIPQLRDARRINPQHVRTQRPEQAGRGRTGDHPGQIQDSYAAQRAHACAQGDLAWGPRGSGLEPNPRHVGQRVRRGRGEPLTWLAHDGGEPP